MRILSEINVTGTDATVAKSARITKGIKGAGIRFVYGPDWAGLRKNVTFRGATTVSVTDADDIVKFPQEVAEIENVPISVGVCGLSEDGEEIVPTIWVDVGTVWPSAAGDFPPPSEEGLPVWAQIMTSIGDLRNLNTEDKSNLVAAVNEAMQNGGGTGGGFVVQDTQPEDTSVLWVDTGDVTQDSGQNVTLSTAQINALDGMFKVCAYDDSKPVAAAYVAFKTAFGITDSGEEEPDEPVVPEVTLTSISAVYSGGDVAVGTAVADLAGIVVTAHYSDGSSKPVTGYTLSGTIAEGSNTVTVSYGGKTTTFTVTGVAESGGETSPAFELAYPLVLGDATDPRITDAANCRIATGETLSDNENWTVCLDFTSMQSGSPQNGVASRIVKNGNNQFTFSYEAPNWVTSLHGQYVARYHDYVKIDGTGHYAGNNTVAVITWDAETKTVTAYGTTEGAKTYPTIGTASEGEIKIGNPYTLGTLNRFAIYKRVMNADEITEWIGG